MRVIFSLGLMINGRTRFPNINEHINEICYILTWSKHTIKFELVELIEFSSRYVTGIIIYIKFDVSLMKNQILMALGVAIVASVLVTGLTSSIYAQSNMTGGNMTGGMSTDGGDNGDGDNGDGGDGSDGQDDDEGSN